MADENRSEGDGLFRLAQALASNNQHWENSDLMKWLETATVNDLRLSFPVLLNWCRNSAKKARKSRNGQGNKSLSETIAESNDSPDHSEPVFLSTTVTCEEVSEKIVKILEEAIDHKVASATNGEQEKIEKQNDSISALRMALAGYLHANHAKMRKVPIVADLERRIKATVAQDRPAINTLNMVNAASPSPISVSKYFTVEEEKETSKGWGIPNINIDLGLGLQQTSPADVCEEFIRDNKPLLHPFTGETVGRMKVKKVFPSKRKPVWIEYYSSDNRPLKPDVLAKQGDDVRNDASVTTVSKLCETIWADAPITWSLGVPPTVCAYDVLVTACDAGYLEMVPGQEFLALTNKAKKTGWEDVDVRKLAPSLVGSYIVNFILGVRDRHEENMMVVGDLKENPRMMQIDFGYVLNEFPGGVHFDMPRLTMPIPLVDRLNAEPGRGRSGADNDSTTTTTLMEDLQHDMLAAYLVLRRHSHQVIPFCAHLMSFSYDYKTVESILSNRHVFGTQRTENKVIKWMSQKLTNQWAHFYFRREFKQGMVSSYYKFVEMTTFEKGGKKKEDEGNSNRTTSTSSTIRFSGRVMSFFKRSSGTRGSDMRIAGKSLIEEEEEDNHSHHSVPEVVTSTKNSEGKQVFKKSRSQNSFVFDMSAVDDVVTSTKGAAPANVETDQKAPSSKTQRHIDMSLLNERVAGAMDFQKEVTKVMISQKETHGTLELKDFGDDEITSSNSI